MVGVHSSSLEVD